MDYSIKVNSNNKTIHVVTKGDITLEHVVAMGSEVFIQAQALGFYVLFDHRLSINRISITDAYYLYSNHYDKVDSGFRRIPIAYIINVEDLKFYSFLECTCILSGITIKIFQEELDAIKWLESLVST